jgi:hypothetical protein
MSKGMTADKLFAKLGTEMEVNSIKTMALQRARRTQHTTSTTATTTATTSTSAAATGAVTTNNNNTHFGAATEPRVVRRQSSGKHGKHDANAEVDPDVPSHIAEATDEQATPPPLLIRRVELTKTPGEGLGLTIKGGVSASASQGSRSHVLVVNVCLPVVF